MDAIDEAILEAWGRLAPRLKQDRVEALRRAARMGAKTLSRPLRPWCLSLRASDTRFEMRGVFDRTEEERAEGVTHVMGLGARALRELCAPVDIDWPGVKSSVAAAKLGRDACAMKRMMEAGVFQVRYQPASTVGRVGKRVPIVWSASLLDPGADLCRWADEGIGTLWQSFWEGLTERHALRVRRVARWARDSRGSRRGDGMRWRGWSFVCPGLGEGVGPEGVRGAEQGGEAARGAEEDGAEVAPVERCGRVVRRLYLPRFVPSIFQVMVPEIARGAGGDVVEGYAERWACLGCHGVISIRLSDAHDWNLFVSRMTQGLLYGGEVERPREVMEGCKKRAAGTEGA